MLKKYSKIIKLEEACKAPESYDMRRDGITQSLCGCFLSCPLRGMLACNRWTHHDKAKSTRFGSLFHDTLDKAYSAAAKPSKATIEKWIDDYVQESAADWSDKPQQSEFDATLASAVFECYLSFWDSDFTKKKFRNVEQTIGVMWNGYLLRGKIDGEFSIGGKVWLMEHKTKSRIDEETLLLKMCFDFQNLFYKTMWQKQNDDAPVAGTLYNVVRKPEHKIKAGEKLADFRERLVGEIIKQPEHFFKRYELAYGAKDDKRFRHELLQKLAWIELFLSGEVNPWRNEFACEQPYKCEYLAACASGNMTGYTQKEKLFNELG